MHLLVKDVVSLLEDRYPPAGAEPWDAVGLVAGDPEQEVRSVLLEERRVGKSVDQV